MRSLEKEEGLSLLVIVTEEEEEEETVFIRGVNTNEDSPNAQHAPHRPRSSHRCNECVASLHA